MAFFLISKFFTFTFRSKRLPHLQTRYYRICVQTRINVTLAHLLRVTSNDRGFPCRETWIFRQIDIQPERKFSFGVGRNGNGAEKHSTRRRESMKDEARSRNGGRGGGKRNESRGGRGNVIIDIAARNLTLSSLSPTSSSSSSFSAPHCASRHFFVGLIAVVDARSFFVIKMILYPLLETRGGQFTCGREGEE